MADYDIPLRPYGSSAGRDHLAGVKPRPKTVTVDLHGHMRIPAADELVKPYLLDITHPGDRAPDAVTQKVRKKQDEDRKAHLTGVEQRLIDMDKMMVDVMAVSCSPSQFYYTVDPSLGLESSQVINDGIVSMTKDHPKRFVGLGTVPLQDTELAIKELKRCVNELGFRGIQIGARVRNEELSTPRLDPFWAACQDLDIVIFIHPNSFVSDRLSPHHFKNIIGNPLDTTVAMHYLIFDGVMERFPKLKFYLAHGGAFASHYSARMDHAYGARSDCRQHIHQRPSTYLKKFYFDSIVFSIEQLTNLINQYGSAHVLIGTDYPFDMGEYDPVEHVYQVSGLSEDDREKICGLNALSLMGLDAGEFMD